MKGLEDRSFDRAGQHGPGEELLNQTRPRLAEVSRIFTQSDKITHVAHFELRSSKQMTARA
ncbi:MAG: hypothetical protein DHS20C15_11630 [Planctomycetota bacterium]|nr:MAG: hypothetical protein DHS20C15_11630 [Planctomycetota bacterium]